MNWLDLGVLLLTALYAFFGYFTGLLRRIIGAVALAAGFGAGTHLGLQSADMLQQVQPLLVPDARLAGFFGFAVLTVVLVELLATFNHDRLQFSLVALNRFSGAVIGLLTGVLASIITVLLLAGYANPVSAGAPTSGQIRVRDLEATSHIAVPTTKAYDAGTRAYRLLQGLLPNDPQLYFTAPSAPAAPR